MSREQEITAGMERQCELSKQEAQLSFHPFLGDVLSEFLEPRYNSRLRREGRELQECQSWNFLLKGSRICYLVISFFGIRIILNRLFLRNSRHKAALKTEYKLLF